MSPRRIELAKLLTLVTLALAAVLVLTRVWMFGQERFFSIDEYQFGHATWLVAQGQRPYVDFFEHHFPLSYALHAGLLQDGGDFVDQALRLRSIVFAYILTASLLAGVAAFAATRSGEVALLSVLLPPAFGFSLMTAVDYRADTLAAFVFLSALFLLEINRRVLRSRAVAAAVGLLAAVAALMTQKMTLVAGGTLALLLAADWLRARARCRGSERGEPSPFVVAPALVVGTGLLCVLGVVAIGGALGLLGDAWEVTIVQAFGHEFGYPAVGVGRYLEPFLAATPVSTGAILLCLALWIALAFDGFWLCPLLCATAFGLSLRGQYPYNYVLSSQLVVLLSVRGYAALVERIPDRRLPGRLRCLLFLLPLALVPDQLGFLDRASSNADQLALLRKIERFGGKGEAVIDNAGGAMFSPHGSYYYHHGQFHRHLFRPYFATELVEDYRRSQALFWIADVRLPALPGSVKRYFRAHYVELDGDLYGLGFDLPPGGPEGRELELDVVRTGRYLVLGRASEGGSLEPKTLTGELVLDGIPLRGDSVLLEVGVHRIVIAPESSASILTLLPAEAFLPTLDPRLRYSRLFEYDSGER